MTVVFVLSVIVFVLLLIGLLPLSVDAGYQEENFFLITRIWFIPVQFAPPKKTSKPAHTEGAEGTNDKAQKKKRAAPKKAMLKLLLQNGFETLLLLVTRLRIDILMIHFTAAGSDPADTAMAYASAGLALETLLRAGEGRIAHSDLRADLDFDGDSPTLLFRIKLSLRVHQIIGLAMHFGCHLLKDYMKLRKARKDENGKSTAR